MDSSPAGANKLPQNGTKPVWTLRSVGADGVMQDHFEATRFKKRRTFDVMNLAPGTYDLFVGIRRDNFFFEQAWGFYKGSDTPLKRSTDDLGLLAHGTEDESDEDPSVGGSVGDDDTSNRAQSNEGLVFRKIRAGVGAAFHGGRMVINAVTLGKMGALAVEFEVIVIDGLGQEIISASELLVCNDKSNFELRFVVADNESTVKMRIKSVSTVHSIYVYASIFSVSEDEAVASTPRERSPAAKVLKKQESSALKNTAATSQSAYDGPTQMLRRALIGSRQPDRAAFVRALAAACFASLVGFIMGFFLDSQVSISIAAFALGCWLLRVLNHVLIIATE